MDPSDKPEFTFMVDSENSADLADDVETITMFCVTGDDMSGSFWIGGLDSEEVYRIQGVCNNTGWFF